MRQPLALALSFALSAQAPAFAAVRAFGAAAAPAYPGAAATAAVPGTAGKLARGVSRLQAAPGVFDGGLPAAAVNVSQPSFQAPRISAGRAVGPNTVAAELMPYLEASRTAAEQGGVMESELWKQAAGVRTSWMRLAKDPAAAAERETLTRTGRELHQVLRGYSYAALAAGLAAGSPQPSWLRFQASKLRTLGVPQGSDRELAGWISRHLQFAQGSRDAEAAARAELPQLREHLGLTAEPTAETLESQARAVRTRAEQVLQPRADRAQTSGAQSPFKASAAAVLPQAAPAGGAGLFQRELAATHSRENELSRELAIHRGEQALAGLRGSDDSSRERLEQQLSSDLAALQRNRDRLYLLRKLSQRADLLNKGDEKELGALKDLLDMYDGIAGGPANSSLGYTETNEIERARLERLQRGLQDLLTGRDGGSAGPERKPPLAGTPRERALAEHTERIERLKAKAQAELAEREAAGQLLAMADRMRDASLRRRRDERDMTEFRKNFSRLAMVMDLSYSLNVIQAAQNAIEGMKALVDGKLKDIDAQRERSRRALEDAKKNSARGDEWEQDVRKKIADNKENEGLFTKLGEQAGKFVEALRAYRTDVPGLLELINARDRGQSGDALTEYARRLALLPKLQEYREHGYPEDDGSVSKLSLTRLRTEVDRVEEYLQKVLDGEKQFDTVPTEFAGVLVIAVPGIPAVSVSNPDEATALRILDERRTFWREERAEYQKQLDSIVAGLGGGSRRVLDDFGDSVPESYTVYRREEQDKAAAAQKDAQRFAADIDARARVIAQSGGGSLPPLGGRGSAELRTLLPDYPDRLMTLNFPDTDEGTLAKIEMLAIARLLPFMGDAVVRWVQAEKTAEIIDEAVKGILPEARSRFEDVTAAVDAVIRDIEEDVAYVKAGFPAAQAQSLIDRKRRLVSGEMKPMLERMKSFLQDRLIPFQQEQIDSVAPNAAGDSMATLYEEKANVYRKVLESYEETIPWSLASQGAAKGDAAGARAKIEEQRTKYNEYRQLIVDFKDDIRRRRDPSGADVEEVYGEMMPFSLVKRIKEYRAETARRAEQINRLGAEINTILTDIDGKTGGSHKLVERFRIPTDVATDQASADRLTAIVDANRIPNLADALKRIADAALAAGSEGGMDIGGGEGIPTGEQPDVTLSDQQQLAVTALEAIKRLVPSSAASNTDSLTEVVARYLFTDGVADASQESLEEQIPIFEKFLDKGEAAIDRIFADLDADAAYVASRGETPAALFARKITAFTIVRDTAGEGATLFNQKIGWDTGSFDTVESIRGYYSSLEDIYGKSADALDAEVQAANKYKEELQKTLDPLLDQKKTVLGWLKQLNDPHESALRRVADNLSAIQDKTRGVLESNINYQKNKKSFDSAATRLQETLQALEREQSALGESIEGIDLADLSPVLADRIEQIGLGGPAWLANSSRGPQSLIIKKSEFSNFLGMLFGSFEGESSARDMYRLREELLKNPMALAQLLPNSRMLELGDDPDGFYLVYSSRFSTPGGLETESSVTLGNALRLGDNNVSVVGHRFASPPSDGNAPFGDQGVTVRVESLQGKNWVNYLDITFHKFIQDIPEELNAGSQVAESRMMVFEDFAVMLAGDKLYFGATGFGDFALNDPLNKPHYYGGNFKTSIKFSEIMKLTAEESILFAKDPRRFLQKVNLDFTGYDPTFDRDYVIDARGDQKRFRREKVGTQLDLQKALKTAESFEVDFFGTNVSGTDDISQQTIGASILKGFAFKVGGIPVRTEVGGSAELGTKYNSGSLRTSFELPNQGLVLSGQGKFLGDAKSYLVEMRKKLGPNTEAFASWGSRYVGINNRLTLGVNTVFTLGELWRSVAGQTAEDLLGGRTLEEFNEDLSKFFQAEEYDTPLIKELQRVFEGDVGRRVLSLEIGRLTRDIAELRRAGAVLDNTRTRAMVGFVTNPVGTDTADRVAGGGFQVGTSTELTLTKTQKALVAKKISSLYAGGLRLQVRLLELTKNWQEAVAEILQSRWERELALFMTANAQDEVTAKKGRALMIEAEARYRQAQLQYNLLTGRSPDAMPPFNDVNPQDMDALLGILGKLLDRPLRLSLLLKKLDRSELPQPEQSFNLMDWIPWIEQMTLSFGAQLHDLLGNQVLGAGISIRLPIYDPNSKLHEKAMTLESEAIISDMKDVYGGFQLRAAKELQEAASYKSQVEMLREAAPEAARALGKEIQKYRNGLSGQDALWTAFERWHWNITRLFDARAREALSRAWAALDYRQGGEIDLRRGHPGSAPAAPVTDLDGAMRSALANSHSLESLAKRSEAVAELLRAAGQRMEKVSVDVSVGANVTADGVSLLPALGLTGLGIFPIVGMRMKPEELKELQSGRRGGESAMLEHLKQNLDADLAFQFFAAYTSYRGVQNTLAMLRNEVLPARERAAANGSAADQHALTRIRSQINTLIGQENQLLVTVNYLLGRPAGAQLDMQKDPAEVLAEMLERFGAASPLAARLGVLRERVAVARSVETIVDKNLRVQDIRVEPISLIGRALGRLVAALSGSGDASPELVALARHQTLEAERDLRAFERELPALRARLNFELEQSARRLDELEYRSDVNSRIEANNLRTRVFGLRAQMAMFGFDAAGAAPAAGLPATFAELQNRLIAAFQAETPSSGIGGASGMIGAPASGQRVTADGFIRFFDSRMSIGKNPIGKQFIEGWVEVRLKSRTTPPEALLALAGLQKEKADHIHRAAIAQASGRARVLLARLRLNAGLLSWARGEGRGAVNRLWLEELERGVSRDLSEVAAHLGLRRDIQVDAILPLIPRDEAVSPAETARVFLREIEETNIEALRASLFTSGLPEELSGAGDLLVQLKSNLIAEKMSFKGFTPVGAIGMFRGRWVSGAFLEAPDPSKIESSLRGILEDALRQELQSQDRLKGLALKLHALMASVIDKTRLLEAQQARLRAAQDNLSGMLALFERGQSTSEELASAQRGVIAAWEDFIDTLSGLRIDFIHLVTELKALGQPSRSAAGPFRPRRSRAADEAPGSRTLDDVARYISQRLADGDFASALDGMFDGKGVVSAHDRAAIAEQAAVYRTVLEAAQATRYHSEIDAAKKLDLLTRLDVEGKRLKLEGMVYRALDQARRSGSAPWGQLNGFLLEDVRGRTTLSAEQIAQQQQLLAGMRQARWGSVELTPAVEEIFAGLETLRGRMDDLRQGLLESYLDAQARPEDFVLKDKALDSYLRSVIEFDQAVVRAYTLQAVRQDPSAAGVLNELFPLRRSIERRSTLLKQGRAMLAVDALIAVEQAHLRALQYQQAGRSAELPVAQRLAYLENLKKRWLENPRKIRSLYAVVKADESVENWLTRDDVKGFERAQRIVRVDGRRWLLPAEHAGKQPQTVKELEQLGASELRAGQDALDEELSEAREKLQRARAGQEVESVLKQAEFVMVGADGRPGKKLDLEELRRLEAEGRVLYFSREADPATGLRRAIHPIAAQKKAPSELIVVAAPEGGAAFGLYASLEALERSPEAANFSRIRTGAKGIKSLIREADDKAQRARQLGWINLKLEAYAFAIDEDGGIAAVYMSKAEYQAMRKELAAAAAKLKKGQVKEEQDEETAADPRLKWSFHLTTDLEWGLASDGTLAEIRDRKSDFSRGLGAAAARWVSGEVHAIELDSKGALVRIFQDLQELKKLSEKWWIEDMSGRVWKQEDYKMSPTYRLKRYIDPETKLPVLLGRKILQQRLDEAADELGAVGRWAYMPWNWANIVFETPRGIIKTPIELITGRDPNQHGYIGRVYMRRTDGGATVRRGAMGQIVHFLDIFELLPDKVDRYMDPSQFPDAVENDSATRVGEWQHEKGPQTERRKIHFGTGSLLRYVRYAGEDIEDARGRILGAFNGGVKQTFVETVRGRAGTYPNAKVDHLTGSQAVDRVLNEMGGLVGAGGTGTWEADPGHIEVDSVRAETQVRLGSRQYSDRADHLRRELAKPAAGGTSLQQLADEVARLEGQTVAEKARRETVKALTAVGPPLRQIMSRTAFPYLTLPVAH
ncbi:MAG: hypothetical protein ABIJ96_17345 [Elusimicrobiota bacterium]